MAEAIQAQISGGFASLGDSLNATWGNMGAWIPLAIVEYGSAWAQSMAATTVTYDPTYQRAIASVVRAAAFGASVELWNGYKGM